MSATTDMQPTQRVDERQGKRSESWSAIPRFQPPGTVGEGVDWMRSPSGLGSRAERVAPSRGSELPERSEKQVLVIVDDDPDDLFFLKRALRKVDVSNPIHSAADGSETLRVLSQLDPEVTGVCLVLDVKLPDVSGFELLSEIKARQLPQALKVVFLTGNRQPRLESRAFDCGADAFFNKPNWHEDWFSVAGALRDLMRETEKARRQ